MSKHIRSRTFQLVVGFTISNENSSSDLLADLFKFRKECKLSTLVLCNADHLLSTSPWIERFKSEGVRVRRVSKLELRSSADQGSFGQYYTKRERQVGIAFFRTALHHYLYLESCRFANPAVWVLDDDVRIQEPSFHHESRSGLLAFVNLVSKLRTEGVAIAIGRVSGDPPIPGASMLRTQLLDLDFNLRAFRNPDFKFNKRALQRQKDSNIEKFQDFYYDLSLIHNGHLETPWFYASERGSSDRLAILEEMLERVPQIAKGVNVFRQIPDLVAPGSHERLLPLTRGGNTLVLDVGCLRDYPNIAPQVGGLRFRRGDTLWTILNGVTGTGKAPRKVVPTNLSVRQDRRYCQSSIFDTQSLLTDIMGGAFTRTMNEILKKSLSKKGNPDAPLRFTSGDIADFVRAFDGRLRERFSLLTLNSWRIVGLVGSIRTQIREIVREGSAELAVFRRHEREIDDFLSSVEAVFSPQAIKKLRTEALEYPRAQLEHFLQELEGNCASYRDQLPPPNSPVDINHTISFLHGHFNNRRFKLLAEAGEGFVLTDGEFAYKYFYHGVYNFHEGQLDFVRNACSIQRLHWAKHIVPIEESLLDGSQVVFVSRLVRGQRYHGGRLSEILELLRECRRARIVLTNISPENIVVTRERLAHVDIGRSVEPFDEHGYREMCRRAFLVYKWHFRSDIKELLTRAMDDDSLPELIGFEQFLVALEEKGVHDVMDDTLLEAVSRDRPSRVLDYGCGNGVVADKMAHWGLELTTFDIDRGRYDDHWHSDNVKFVHRDRLDELKRSLSLFDVVLCNLVLCSVEDSETVAQILKDLRSLVDHNGSVILGICNPFGLETEESETEIKKVPKGRRYSEHFSYQKSMKVSRGVRTDFHRPFSWYKMMLRRAGLNISELIEVPGTDVPRLTPGSDFLVLRLKPAPIPSRSNVSLLIKASAMEWRTIEKQVTHLVNQLEVPRLFLEKVVVIDNNQGPFARQYDTSDLRALKRTLGSMVEQGIIDRVLVAPDGARQRTALNRRWFSLNHPVARSENGQPTLMTIYGIEKCMGEYVLHVDSDCLVRRSDPDYDYLQDLLKVFDDDRNCVTVSLSVASRTRSEYTSSGESGKWRTEVRCGVLSKARLRQLLPLPNEINKDGLLAYPWHRALDIRMRQSEFQSYRIAEPKAFFIHVPNERKADFNSWYNIMKAVQDGLLYDEQIGHVDLVGTVEDWLPTRSESCILIVRGRNVPISKLRRCFESIARQTDQDWGLIVVDAGSDNGADEYVEEIIRPRYGRRMTFYRNLIPAPPIANIDFAVRRLCRKGDSLIIMPDADDAFASAEAVSYVKSVFSEGADFAVGGLLRSDKETHYAVKFREPRQNRGGNVWQPLRSFRKHLFDGIRAEDLKIDGVWVPHTEDWAFMLPMAELAKHPAYLTRVIYLYEPSSLKQTLSKDEREDLIAKIVSKPSYRGARR